MHLRGKRNTDDEKDEFMRRYILSKKLFEKDHNELKAFIKSTISDQMKYLLYKVLCFIGYEAAAIETGSFGLGLDIYG